MQGYYSYRLFGEKKELKLALEEIKKKAETDVDYAEILEFAGEVEKSYFEQGNYLLTFELPSSGNINSVPFLFEDMMQKLCNDFPQFEATGTGYFLDFPPYPEWTSKAGDSSFTEKMGAIMTYDSFSKDECISENGEILKETICFTCEVCEADIELKTKDLLDEEGSLSFANVECTCEECSTDYELEIEFE